LTTARVAEGPDGLRQIIFIETRSLDECHFTMLQVTLDSRPNDEAEQAGSSLAEI
jgi:hypothetical protein